jgi:hypothetical protein
VSSEAPTIAWAARLPRESSRAAAGLRLRTDLLVADAAEHLWLRGETLSPELELELRKISGAERFDCADGGALTPRGARVPTLSLPPDLAWQKPDEFFRVTPQPASLAGEVSKRATLRVVRDPRSREREANVLVASLRVWVQYASTAPLVRLRPLRFAASADGCALVRGTPLPPLAGRRYVEHQGVALPSGFAFSPAIDAAGVRALLGTDPQSLALFDEDGTYERIEADQFMAVSRSAARATGESFGGM